MPVPTSAPSPDVLDSWKEVAAYLSRDVRTVMRWEQTRGLPIHRLPGGSAVYALRSELDAWRRGGLRLVSPSEGERTAAAPSVAVLPFANLTGDKESEYFSDGLADEIITALARVPGLHVSARTSSFAFRGKENDVREIGRRLGWRSCSRAVFRSRTGGRVFAPNWSARPTAFTSGRNGTIAR